MFNILKELLEKAISEKNAKLKEQSTGKKIIPVAIKRTPSYSNTVASKPSKPPTAKLILNRPKYELSGLFCDWLVTADTVHINKLLEPPTNENAFINAASTPNQGIPLNINSSANDATDIVMGIDFGTSSTKVVLRDVSLGKAFVVDFGASKEALSNQLIASHVFVESDIYSLSEGQCIKDLKLRIMQQTAEKVVNPQFRVQPIS